eukprot:s3514_g9.t1
MYKPGDPDIPNWDSKKTAEIENGWAAVCFHHGDVQRAAYFQGRLPSVLARQFSSHQAFVYLREAWVAILAPLIFQPWLDSFYVQCCDNEASRHALLKGANISDGISRFEHVEEAADWVKLDLLLQALTSRAAKIIGDIYFAASVGFSEMPEAYSLLGVDPRCSNTELKHAFRRAVALQSAEVLPGDGAACLPFGEVLRAMELIRSARQMPLLDVRNLDGGENLRICRRPLETLPLQSHSQLASFIGGMAAQPTTSMAF